MLPDSQEHGKRALMSSASSIPELLPIVQIEGNHGSTRFCRVHRLDDELRGRFGERRENPTTVEPAHARPENGGPVEVTRLQLCSGFVAAVVEDNRPPDAVAPVAVDRRHVRTARPVMFEAFVEWPHAHRTYALGDEV